ncbi:MAG: hypothetical protein RLZZ241_748 [Bacteroidota bacterium]|jgi:flagellar biogenesis protein FliO
MHKIIKIVLVVLGAIGVLLWLQLPSASVPPEVAVESASMHWMFMITYLLLAIAVVFSLLYALKNLFSNPQNLKKTLFVLVGLVIVVGISYALSDGADGTVEEMASRGVATTEGTVKNIGAGLNMFFILVLIAIASMAWGGLKKITNK